MAFEQFPYTNFHELNTDWVLKTLKDLKIQAETLQAQAEEALQEVEGWESRIQAAEAAAQAAETAAGNAETAAQAAETAAGNAENSAENSLTAATAAQTQATNAAASASTAQTQATNAAASASAAQTQATNAASSAYEAQTQATNAAASAASAITAAQAAKAGYYEITLEYPQADQSSNITLPDTHFQDFLEDFELDKKPIIVKLIQAGNGQGVIDSYAYLPARIYDWDQTKIELELEYNLIVYHITWFYPGEGTSHYTRWITTDKVPPAVASANSGKFLKSTGSSMMWDNIPDPINTVSDLVSTSVTLATAANNTIYEYGTLSNLTISAITNPGNFIVRFISGSTATSVSFPATMIFPDTFTPAANKRYEINVSNGYALAADWPAS